MKTLCLTSYTKKPKSQYDETIEFSTVQKFCENFMYHKNKQPNFTNTTTKGL